MIDQGQSQSQFPQERLSATKIGLLTRRAEPATTHHTDIDQPPQAQHAIVSTNKLRR